MNKIHAEYTVSITELKANPNKVLANAKGSSVAVLSRNEPKAYFVPANLYHELLEQAEDCYWNQMIELRKDEESVEVCLDDL